MKRADKNKIQEVSPEIEKLVDETSEEPITTVENPQIDVLDGLYTQEVIVEEQEEQEIPKAPVKTVEVISEVSADGQVWWKNNGGTFRIGSKRIIKPGEKFQAFPHEVSKAFRDVIVPIHRSKEELVVVKAVIPVYKLQENAKKGFFDIVNEQGKVLNDIPLEESVAQNLIADLSR